MIKKRDGTEVVFDERLIRSAIWKAAAESDKEASGRIADEVGDAVLESITQAHQKQSRQLTVEDVQDMVETALLDGGHVQIARDYIRYRHEHRQLRAEKQEILGKRVRLCDVSKKFDIACLRVLASRYLFRNNQGEIIETPKQMFERVALLMGIADIIHDRSVQHVSHDTNNLPADTKDDDHKKRQDAISYLNILDELDGKFQIKSYTLNKWHLRSLVKSYMTAAPKLSVSFQQLLDMITRGDFDHLATTIDKYYELMVSQKFLPNSPTLMNAGGRLGQLSACFVLGMDDSLQSIMKTSSDATMIFQSGGGVGINYSDLRPAGDMVASTSGVASGPVSFMNIINTITDVVKQGGKRRGANMGIMEVWHPDIETFIRAKQTPGVLENFNVSVGIWEDFWNCVTEGRKYSLKSPQTGKSTKETDARKLFDLIAESAYMAAEPGLIFFDNCNTHNVFAKARGGPLRATNPCSEQSLYPYESCNLGSINVANLLTPDGAFDWEQYIQVIRTTTRFLDAVVDMNTYPIPEITRAAWESRRIGLGVMGVADLLYKLRIQYNSARGFALQSKLAEYLTYYSMDESVELARERGTFGLYEKTEYPEGKLPVAGAYDDDDDDLKQQRTCDWNTLTDRIQKYGIRNVVTTTVAPTGTIAMIASCSNGMEPVFALSYEKHVTVGSFHYANRTLRAELEARGLYNEAVAERITEMGGSIRADEQMPSDMRRVFVTAADIHWADHLMAQAVWQKWITNGISKTINMPSGTDVSDVKAAYVLAHELGLKGITVYRDGSRDKQVLHHGKSSPDNAGTNAGSDMESLIGGGKKAEAADNIQMCDMSDTTRDVIKQIQQDNEYVRDVLSCAFVATSSTTTTVEHKVLDNDDRKSDMMITAVKEAAVKEMATVVKEAAAAAAANNELHSEQNPRECPTCTQTLVLAEGCSYCPNCGFSGCST